MLRLKVLTITLISMLMNELEPASESCGIKDKDIMPAKKIRVLHGSLEYTCGVGGIASVTTGLLPELIEKGIDPSIVTPFFDSYRNDPKYASAHVFTTVRHIFKGKAVTSKIYRVVAENVNKVPVYHYLIQPTDEALKDLFNIENDASNIYKSFPWSSGQDRREYFSSGIAAMLRAPNDRMPEFDIYHAHAWHAGLAIPIAEELEHLPKWKELYLNSQRPLRKNPYKVSTVHMLLAREHGELSSKKAVDDMLYSLGFPDDYAKKFDSWKQFVNPGHVKQVVPPLLYSDHVTTVSEGLAYDAAYVKGGGQGLDDLFNWLAKHQRFTGILNGIKFRNYDATSASVLGEFALNSKEAFAGKMKIKQHLQQKFSQLDPNKPWFCSVQRFAWEKGVDMLLDAADEIGKQGGVLVIMGKHVSTKIVDGKSVPLYQDVIDKLRLHTHVLVIDDPQIQKEYGSLVRAGSDFTLVPSHNEACGLVHLEGYANGCSTVAANLPGTRSGVRNLDDDPEHGTGFLYDDNSVTRKQNMRAAIRKAHELHMQRVKTGSINSYIEHLLTHAKTLDWSRVAKRYALLYHNLLQRPRLTYDRVRTVQRPMLNMLKALQESAKHKAELLRKRAPAPSASSHLANIDSYVDKPFNGKVFVIGPNKCGTTHVYYGFMGSGIPSVHYGIRGRTIAATIYDNFKHGRKLLDGIDDFVLYSDMEDIYHPEMPLYIAEMFLEKLDEQYPGSIFIFNTRDKELWLRSRFMHVDPMNGKSYPAVMCERYNCTPDELYERWSREWDEFEVRVKKHFANRPNDLVVYHIERDSPQKLIDALPPGLNLDVTKFKVANKTKVEAAKVVSKNPGTAPVTKPASSNTKVTHKTAISGSHVTLNTAKKPVVTERASGNKIGSNKPKHTLKI